MQRARRVSLKAPGYSSFNPDGDVPRIPQPFLKLESEDAAYLTLRWVGRRRVTSPPRWLSRGKWANGYLCIAMNRFCLLILAALTTQIVHGGEFYVSPSGDDGNPGTLAKPFVTLSRAQQAVRKLAGREPVTVLLRAGTYYLSETLLLTGEDSGTKAAPVSYRTYEKEEAVISGGIRLHGLKWEPYQNGILRAKVPAGFATDQLFVNGERQRLARYPNFDPTVRHFNGWAKDAFSPERAARWKNPTGGFIHALHAAEWGGMHYVITGKDAATKLLTRAAGRTTGRPACTTTGSSKISSRNWMRRVSGS